MRVHLEGMGINGSLLALKLAERGVGFTWHDTIDPKVAWPASTGAIYPGGSEKFGPDAACHEEWLRWYEQGFANEFLELGSFTFCTKSPPHGGRYSTTPVGALNVAALPSLHLNAQKLVVETRAQFSKQRREVGDAIWDDGNLIYIVTHGWGERLGHVYWGWTRLVELQFNPKQFEHRPAFYFREGRFIMAYAYPVPGTPYWYAGSNIIKQRADARKSLSMEDKYERWKTNFERLGDGQVKVGREGDFIEGWRPAAAKEDEAWVRRKGNVLTFRPLWNSGIRHFPKQWAAVAAQLGLNP